MPLITSSVQYRNHEARELAEADRSQLENVREQHQRAANAWGKLAAQIENVETERSKRIGHE